MYTGIDAARFARAVQDAKERQAEGIGMLGEKLLHASLKNYFSGENGLQEAPVGRYVADVLLENEIVEIQTGSLFPLKKKIAAFLPVYPVTVVYPVMRRKRLYWIDPVSGEISGGNMSPKKGRPGDALPELLYLSEFIGREGFRVLLFFYDGEEYKRKDGWGDGGKRGAHRAERVPLEIADLMLIENRYDLGALLPEGCPGAFDQNTFARLAGLKGRKLWAALRLLEESGTLIKEKNGKMVSYTVSGKEFIK